MHCHRFCRRMSGSADTAHAYCFLKVKRYPAIPHEPRMKSSAHAQDDVGTRPGFDTFMRICQGSVNFVSLRNPWLTVRVPDRGGLAVCKCLHILPKPAQGSCSAAAIHLFLPETSLSPRLNLACAFTKLWTPLPRGRSGGGYQAPLPLLKPEPSLSKSKSKSEAKAKPSSESFGTQAPKHSIVTCPTIPYTSHSYYPRNYKKIQGASPSRCVAGRFSPTGIVGWGGFG